MSSSRALRVGFIGLGKMGYPIAAKIQNCSAPVNVHVFNRTSEKCEEHAKSYGTTPPSSYKPSKPFLETVVDDLAPLSPDFVFTCLPRIEDSGKIIRALDKNCKESPPVYVDLTSGHPEKSRCIASGLHGQYIDAPISGGPSGAESGTLTAIVGASQITSLCEKLMLSYCDKIVLTGGVGNGNAVKAVNNYLNVSHLMIASDALLGLKKFGVPPEVALSAINNSSGRSLQTEVRIPECVLNREFSYGFALQHMAKDVLENASPLFAKSLFFETMSKPLHGNRESNLDYTSIVKDLERHHGEKL